MKHQKLTALAITFLTVFSLNVRSATWHADAAKGRDTNPGTTRAAAFATLQRAIDAAQPGDTVVAYPGIYYEHITIRRGGTASAPIRIMADRVERDRVIISGAQRNIREKRIAWELVDPDLGLYRVPFDYRPTRVLANRADLLAYPTLADLRAFRFIADDYLGHKHGFAYDPETKHLYVRLRSDGRYGPTDPNADAVTLSVSPPTGAGRFGVEPTKRPDNYNLALRFSGPAHIVIDGFTFETPGIAGIYTTASDLTIRNNWFYGCRIGIAAPRADIPEACSKPHANRVLVEHNYFTQFPAFTDIEDITPAEAADQRTRPEWRHKIVHWQRKGTRPHPNQTVGYPYGYEVGAIRGAADGWEIRNNHFYDMFEALSGGAIGHSANANIHHNRFERICDNAIETEPRARNLRIHHNLVIDTFEPFSWQPQAAVPLPGPIFVYDNIILQTPRTQAMLAANTGASFKLGIKDDDWQQDRMGDIPPDAAPAPGGFWAAHNTVFTPSGRLLTLLNPPQRRLRDFYFINNIFLAHTLAPRAGDSGIVFDGNIAGFQGAFPSVLAVTTIPALASTAAGPHGRTLPNITENTEGLRLPLDESNAFAPFTPDSALAKVGIDLAALTKAAAIAPPGQLPIRSTPGAAKFDIIVGPQPRADN
ncbi:hypothetical protein Ga0100231_018600 [Opitutaceae bacterium TAV4]|nr:hypothetical protein Ga0100231_018600 [Opitutaceae bacterium TAV4]RRK00121.1 hypothetical protein Ga0100230_019260 [Opitutaceae bacterium TAV3]